MNRQAETTHEPISWQERVDAGSLGLYRGIDNAEYRAGPGISKSQLDMIHQSPSLLAWYHDAPVDEEAEKAVDIGNAFETLLLEPERFRRTYLKAPDVDRRTKEGKAAAAEFDERVATEGLLALTHDQWRQIHLMRDSTMAHPVARRAFEAAALVQASYFWRDGDTDLLCRCRPDWMLDHTPFVIDVKVTGQIERFATSVEEYRHHVQDAFYSDGLTAYYGGVRPSFAFVVVSTSRSAGRYPVHVYELDEDDKAAGRTAYRADLALYARCLADGEFTHVEPLTRPWWARRRDEVL